jgi:dTDP-4-dehydrorhamnose reductase
MADCRDADDVRSIVSRHRPQFVINSAAYIRVDDCEDHPLDAFAVNAIGAYNIARACAEYESHCVYISTDYVFDGSKTTPYVEWDMTCPINVYGASKLAGEHLVRQISKRWLIVRTASLFGKSGARSKSGNFVETVLDKAKSNKLLTVVDDIRISPTYTRDAAKAIVKLLSKGQEGLVHVVNSGECTWYEFAREVLNCCQIEATIRAVDSSCYPLRAKRPRNSSLESTVLSDSPPPWQQALAQYLREKGHLH